MQNRLWNASLRLGLIVLVSAGLMIGAEIVGVSVRPGFAQEEQQEQRLTGRLSEESETLEDGSYYNVHVFEAEAGQSFLIEMVSDAFDTYLILIDADGNQVVENDDGENGTNAHIAVTAKSSGEHTILASSYSAGEVGAYTITVHPTTIEEVQRSEARAEADHLLQQGIEQVNRSQLRDAFASWQSALDLYRALADPLGEARSLNNLGGAHVNVGQYREAIAYHEQSLAIFRAIEDTKGEAGSLNNLGEAYRHLGQYWEAIAYYEQSLAISQSIEDVQGEAYSLNNLGIAYDSLGQHQEAIAYYEQSLAIKRAVEDIQGEANSLMGLGAVYDSIGQHQESIVYHEISLEIYQSIEDVQGEANALMGLGNAYFDLEQYLKAVAYYEQSLATYRAIEDVQGEANALGNLGAVYNSLGQHQEAIAYLELSLAIKQSIEDVQGEAYSLNNLGAVYFNTQQYTDAESALSAAIRIFEVLRDSELPDADKVSLFEMQKVSYVILQQVLVAQNKTNPALEIAERSRARALVEFLSDRVSERTAEDVTIAIPSLAEIQRIAQQQNATLVSYSIINFQNQDPLLYIWVIQPTGAISFQSVDLSSLNAPLSDLITLSRSNLGVRSRNDGNIVSVLSPEELQRQREQQRQSLNDLYNILITPIAESLPTDEGDRIIFIPQGELFSVPFAALVDNKDQYLIESHTLSIAPSIQTLALTRQLHNPNGSLTDNPLIVGNPTMPRLWNPSNNLEERLPSLPGAENEARAIAQQLNTEALLWDNASETRVAQQMQNASLIHLATHGLLDYGTPEETGIRDVPGAIALAPDSTNDGLLTSAEILTMQLQANLVVLSACDTGRGTITGDGVIGLSRSLMQAGVSSVVVSLWSVPDDSTEFLMKEFYANLDEMDKAQALRQAMLATMQQSEYIEPLDWAAFTLIGEAN